MLGAAYGLLLPQAVPYITFLGDIFLRLLKMLIAPLVLFTLVSGVCKMGDVRQLRTVGVRIVVYYLISSAIAAAVGMGIALISQPGRGVTDLLGSEAGEAVSYNFLENLISWVPTNIFEALTTGNTLQIIVFSILLGVVLLFIGDYAEQLIRVVHQAADAMVKMTDLIMKISPSVFFLSLPR